MTAAPYSTHSLKPWESAAGRTWYPGGNVGIGLASPATPLTLLVNGGTRPVGLTQNQIGSDTLEMTSTDAANQQATRLALRGGTNNARVEFYRGPRGSETEAMRINAAGDIGIGLTDPLDSLGYPGGWKGLHIAELAPSQHGVMCIEGANRARLHLRNNARATNRKDFAITYDGQVDFSWLDASLGTRLTVLTINHQGNVAVGSATGEGRLSIENTSNASALNIESSHIGLDVYGEQTAIHATTTTPSGTAVHAESGYFAIHGDCLLPAGGPAWAGHFTGNVYFDRLGIFHFQSTNELEVNGQASKSSPGEWLQNSDARIKTNVQTIPNALETLERVRLVDYAYTDSYRSTHPEVPNRRYMGVIAQEFAGVFPEYVQPGSDTLPNGDAILQVDTYPLEVYTAAAMQQLHQEVRRREDENRSLRERAKRLIERVSKLEAAHTGT